MPKKLKPIHPGVILHAEFMEPLGVSQNKLARDIDVPPGRINEVVKGKREVTADTALRLSVYFGTSAEFWLNLQNRYALACIEDEAGARIRKSIRTLKPVKTAA